MAPLAAIMTQEVRQLAKEEKAEIEGIVVDNPRNFFLVQTDIGDVLCTISGKIRKHKIRITQGDKVIVAISAYDMEKGIIKKRLD